MAKAVLQDLGSFEQTQETLALLKILALGQAQIVKPHSFSGVRAHVSSTCLFCHTTIWLYS